ncbi:hypothetical protein EV356DRAFT_246320 [Viridothelium virens]|uniref:Uncharacterized protein n=1 Tax=Viridothelium virens TaxID=1048519 RepID=A0A6A6H3C7_VIRVR|nr:hypothetical protein EV356DRAFT_246320 [Viridothelium virens]
MIRHKFASSSWNSSSRCARILPAENADKLQAQPQPYQYSRLLHWTDLQLRQWPSAAARISFCAPQEYASMLGKMTVEKSLHCCKVDILKRENGQWSTNYAQANIDELCKIISEVPSTYLISATAQSLRDCSTCSWRLREHLTWSSFLGIDDGQISNGYTGHEDLFDRDGKYLGHTSRTRFLIKRLLNHYGQDGKNYVWEALSFFTKWVSPHRNVVVFFDIPMSVRPRFPTKVLQDNDSRYLHNPYWIHVLAVQEIINLQDDSVWSIRDAVRETERVGKSCIWIMENIEFLSLFLRDNSLIVHPNYPKLHDIARHAIHSHESLRIAESSVRSLINQHDTYLTEDPPSDSEAKVAAKHLKSRLAFQCQLLESLKFRSQSNREETTK